MLRKVVDSRSLASVGYDRRAGTLEIEFVNGSVYQYFDVPASVVGELLSAESVGRYFNTHVRPHYRYARV